MSNPSTWTYFCYQVSKIQCVHGCCEVRCVLCVYDTNIGTDFSCCSYVSLRCWFPCPIVDVALESWLTPLELGLPSACRSAPRFPCRHWYQPWHPWFCHPLTPCSGWPGSLPSPSFGMIILGLLKLC